MARSTTPDEELPLAVKITAAASQMWRESDPERTNTWDSTNQCPSVGLLVGPQGGRRRMRCSKAPGHVGPHIHYAYPDIGARRPFARWARDL